MIIPGKTKSGFSYKIQKESLENYELIEALSELDDNPLAITKVVNLIFGKEQVEKLKNHLRDENGIVSVEKMSEEVSEVFQNSKIKKS